MIPTGKCDRTFQRQPDLSRYLENLSLNLSPKRRVYTSRIPPLIPPCQGGKQEIWFPPLSKGRVRVG